jgi:hypothetical protein
MWERMKKRVAKRKMTLAGNEARNCTRGCSSRARMSSPRRNTLATSAGPTRVSTKWSRADISRTTPSSTGVEAAATRRGMWAATEPLSVVRANLAAGTAVAQNTAASLARGQRQ